jgi:hypothetical protein
MHSTYGPNYSRQRQSESWETLVEQYTRCKLTFCSDRLMAFAGIAKTDSLLRNGDTYIAGLWKRRLPYHFLWHVAGAEKLRDRLRDFIAPTWSWASIDQPVSFVERLLMGSPELEVLDTQIAASELSPFGSVDASPPSFVQVRGRIRPAVGFQLPLKKGDSPWQLFEGADPGWRIFFDTALSSETLLSCRWRPMPEWRESALRQKKFSLWYLQITQNVALIVTPVVNEWIESKGAVYERVGIGFHSHPQLVWNWFENSQEKSVICLV